MLPDIAETLGIDFKVLMQHYGSRDVIANRELGLQYLRFKKNVGKIEHGTVVFVLDGKKGKSSELVFARGFPKIRRAMLLKPSLEKHFGARFARVEEKLDGYNVRTLWVDEKIVCLTRGGVVCPYTTMHVNNALGSKGFFKENPTLMLCGEVVGLNNPYQMKSYPEARDFGYFIFDIRDRKTGVAVSVEEREKLLEKYDLPQVHDFGVFSSKDAKRLLSLVRSLGNEGREGVVLKSDDMKTQVKYTANASTNTDLSYAFKFCFDYGQAFMFRRLVREAFQAHELGLSGKELDKEAAELGKAILLPMVDTIKRVAAGEEVTEDFEIKVPDEDFGKAFVEHLKAMGVKASISATSKNKDGSVTLLVKRHYQATNDKIKAYKKGEFCQD